MAGSEVGPSDAEKNDSEAVCDRNPSPPPELLENKDAIADIIPGTAVSKRWVLQTLFTALQAVNSESPLNSKGKYDDFIDLDETIEEEICKLWDLSGDNSVGQYLIDIEAYETLLIIISKSKAPRIIEISVGILANLACCFEFCEMLPRDSLIKSTFSLLDYPDSPTLLQTIRLFNVCVITPTTSANWLNAIKDDSYSVLNKLCFILESTTNCDLLKSMSELLDNILDLDDGLCQQWSGRELIAGIIEAMKQLKNFYPDTRDTYCHILQMISTTEKGAHGIRHYGDSLFKLLKEFLKDICEDDFLCINGRLCGIASTVALLIIVCAEPESNLLKTDSQILTYILQLVSVCNSQEGMFTNNSSFNESSRPDTNMNNVLKETLIAFWCHVIQELSLPKFVLDELENAPTKKLKILLNELKKIPTENFDYIGYIASRIEDGNYNKLHDLLKAEEENSST